MKPFRSRNIDKTPDLVVLNNGGGVQTGMLIELLHLALTTNDDVVGPPLVKEFVRLLRNGEYRKPDAVIQADTGSEPAYIYRQWERDKYLCAEMGIPYIAVENGNISEDAYGNGIGGKPLFAAIPFFTRRLNGSTEKRGIKVGKNQGVLFDFSEFEEEAQTTIHGFGVTAQIAHDGKMKRQCTSEYKIQPILKELRTMLLEMNLAREYSNGAIHVNRGVVTESWIGYTTDEIRRVKDFKEHWQIARYPLIEMRLTKSDCKLWLEANGRPNRLSSACRECPLIGNQHMRELRDNDPDGWQYRLKYDHDLRNGSMKIAASTKGALYLHSSMIPLSEIDIDETGGEHDIFCSNIGCMT